MSLEINILQMVIYQTKSVEKFHNNECSYKLPTIR